MNTEQARFSMIEQQIRPWDVRDPKVLQLFTRIPRELFVPPPYQALAFSDIDIPLAHEQCMMTPKVEARMLQSLEFHGSEKILEIGTGSGFVTCCLAQLGASVLSLDCFSNFIEGTRPLLDQLNTKNAELQHSNLYEVLDSLEHFDVIVVTASLPSIDKRLLEKLTLGGRAFMVVGKAPAMTARVITRVNETEYRTRGLFETRLTPMIGCATTPEFEF